LISPCGHLPRLGVRLLVVAMMVLAMGEWPDEVSVLPAILLMAMFVDWVLTGLYAVEEVLEEVTIRVMIDPEALPDVEVLTTLKGGAEVSLPRGRGSEAEARTIRESAMRYIFPEECTRHARRRMQWTHACNAMTGCHYTSHN
jgi:hypothetical protein